MHFSIIFLIDTADSQLYQKPNLKKPFDFQKVSILKTSKGMYLNTTILSIPARHPELKLKVITSVWYPLYPFKRF